MILSGLHLDNREVRVNPRSEHLQLSPLCVRLHIKVSFVGWFLSEPKNSASKKNDRTVILSAPTLGEYTWISLQF